MNATVTTITALIGVCGTLIGTLLGWILNSQSYRIGRTKIFSTFTVSTKLPPVILSASKTEDYTSKRQKRPETEYLFQCVAINSRQIAVLLENFSVEMRATRRAKPIRLSVVEPEIEYADIGGLKIGAQLALPRKVIPPRTLYEFIFKVDYHKPDIQYSRLELIAFNEKHRCQRFLLYDGLKLTPPPER